MRLPLLQQSAMCSRPQRGGRRVSAPMSDRPAITGTRENHAWRRDTWGVGHAERRCGAGDNATRGSATLLSALPVQNNSERSQQREERGGGRRWRRLPVQKWRTDEDPLARPPTEPLLCVRALLSRVFHPINFGACQNNCRTHSFFCFLFCINIFQYGVTRSAESLAWSLFYVVSRFSQPCYDFLGLRICCLFERELFRWSF